MLEDIKQTYKIDKRACVAITIAKILKRITHAKCFDRSRILQKSYIEPKFRCLARQYTKKSYGIEQTPYTNNTIWVYWAQGREEMPNIVKRCVEQIDKMKGSYQLVLLDNETYEHYVDLPKVIRTKLREGKISLTTFSDILRFALLHKYGGWWMDATIYPLYQLEKQTSLYTLKTEYCDEWISCSRWSAFLWYLPAGHPLSAYVSVAWEKYWSENDCLIEYFLTDHFVRLFYDTNLSFREEIDSLEPSSNLEGLYFMQSKEALRDFDENRWKEICTMTKFLKCSWKTMPDDKDVQTSQQSYIARL